MPGAPRSRGHGRTFAEAISESALVACPHCDLLQRLPALSPGASACCPRCDTELWRRRVEPLERTLALAIAGVVLYAIANLSPMLGLDAAGHTASTTVLGGARRLWADGEQIVSVLVFATAVVAPALQIAFMLLVSIAARQPRPARWVGILLRHHPATRTWSMIEVMMIGVLVALIKIAELATVVPGAGLFALGGLVFLLPAMQSAFDAREVWERVEWAEKPERRGAVAPVRGAHADVLGSREQATRGATAMQLGLASCEVCGLCSRPAGDEIENRCPRCGARLEVRRPGSLERTWALLIAAAICYVPANLLPVLTTTTIEGTESDTILQGVVLLWSPTGWPLSLIVLIASVMIPSAKILALAYLVVTVQRGSISSNAQRLRLYHAVEIVGRWSMIDVFVDTFTAALVQLPPLMSMAPAPGLFFFAAVVVLTMLAVEAFDPRLIWDPASASEPAVAGLEASEVRHV